MAREPVNSLLLAIDSRYHKLANHTDTQTYTAVATGKRARPPDHEQHRARRKSIGKPNQEEVR